MDSFTEWAQEAESRLRHALTASFGSQIGKEAAADALAHAWEHWDRIKMKDNPLGYVFGGAATRPAGRSGPFGPRRLGGLLL